MPDNTRTKISLVGNEVKDAKNRTLLRFTERGNIVLSRFEDTPFEDRMLIAEIAEDVSDMTIADALSFLNFEDGDNNIFCS